MLTIVSNRDNRKLEAIIADVVVTDGKCNDNKEDKPIAIGEP